MHDARRRVLHGRTRDTACFRAARRVGANRKADHRSRAWRLGRRLEPERRHRAAAQSRLHRLRAAESVCAVSHRMPHRSARFSKRFPVRSCWSVTHTAVPSRVSRPRAIRISKRSCTSMRSCPMRGDSCLSLLSGGPPPPKDLFTPVPFATAGGGDADSTSAPKYYQPCVRIGRSRCRGRADDRYAASGHGRAQSKSKSARCRRLENDPVVVRRRRCRQRYPAAGANDDGAAREVRTSRTCTAAHPSIIQHPEATVAAIDAAIAAIK